MSLRDGRDKVLVRTTSRASTAGDVEPDVTDAFDPFDVQPGARGVSIVEVGAATA